MGGKPLKLEEIQQMLWIKADRADVGILDKTKADKRDTDSFKNIVQFVSTQTEHLLTLSIENLKIDIDCVNDSQHTQINK